MLAAIELQEEVYGPIRINDAQIEIVELIVENTRGFSSCPPHRHSWFEFNYIFEGSMRTGFGGPMLDVGPGDFFLIPPGVEHSHEYEPESPHQGVCLRWTLRAADSTPGNGPGSVYDKLSRLADWDPGCYPDAHGLGDELRRLLLEARKPVAPVLLQLSIVKLLLQLASIREPQGRVAEGSELTNATFLRKIDIYLNDDRWEKMNVVRMAASFHMNYHHLARKYKQLTGRTLLQRLTEIRLERALKLLIETDESISSIAEKSGFGTVYYFSRVFKSEYGLSPKQYRRRGDGS